MPLWARLVLASLVLVAIALVITGWIGAGLLRSYMTHQVDGRLVGSSRRFGTAFDGGRYNLPGRPNGLDVSRGAPNSFVFEFLGPDGKLLADPTAGLGAGPTAPDLTGLDANEAASHGDHPYTVVADGTRWRVVLHQFDDGSTLATMTNLAEVDHAHDHLVGIEILVGLIALVVLAGLGVIVVRLSLRPLSDIEATAEAIGAGDLSRRVPDADPHTEVGRLATALNGMLGQIEHASRAQTASEHEARATAERMRRFAADASHELRTPLTSIRGFAELHRQRGGGTADETDRLVGRIESEATRMSRLVEDLLTLARLDQQRPLAVESVDLIPVATDAAFDLRTLDPGREVVLDLPSEPVTVLADPDGVRQVVANLVANVRTHTPPDAAAKITVRNAARAGRAGAFIEVEDSGLGLAPDRQAKVFERFYRVDDARTRPAGGAGLGLSIVSALVHALHGAVEVESTPGQGATFRVWLPSTVDSSTGRGMAPDAKLRP
ncbi:MAG: HAMP domain-containing sensor histidine kinase [Acidimicrobiales bacterium]